MTKQLVISLAAGLLLSLPGCTCNDECKKKIEAAQTETNVDAQATCVDANCADATCTDAACTTVETKSETEAPAKF